MSEDQKERFRVSADDLRSYDWQERIAKVQRPERHHHLSVLGAGAKAYDDAGDDLGHRVFSLLHAVASFHLNQDSRGNPYGPMWTNSDGSRSLCAEDLSDSDLAALSGIIAEIADPEFRSRVADVLWVTKKDFRAAKLAVAAFLESAGNLKTDDLWPPYAERLERAARISVIRGFETENATVVSTLKTAVVEFETNLKSGLLCHRLMSILLSLEKGDAVQYAALSERLARQFADAGNWHFSEDYWQLAEQWHRRAKNAPEAQRCAIEAAECNISNGQETMKGTGGAMSAATWLGKGLEALRRAKGSKSRIEEVHRLLLEVQARIPDEMGSVGPDVDEIPGFRKNEALYQKASREFVSGLDFRTALERFANVAQPTDFEETKRQHAESSKEFIFQHIVGISQIDHDGKTSDVLPPLIGGTPEEQAEAQLKHLYNQARTIQWQMPVAWRIEPAREAIVQEHAVRRSDLLFLVANNPLIPQGHEGIVLRGIQAGFHGDWLMAMHLLIPQLEASIREVLQQLGAITSGMRDGIQAEKQLKDLMEMPEFLQFFGPDILFDLRGIMIERFGHNMRNEFAHGLLPEGGFYRSASVYLWWLAIHLYWRGFRLTLKKPEPDSD
jgi:hypothetical protein